MVTRGVDKTDKGRQWEHDRWQSFSALLTVASTEALFTRSEIEMRVPILILVLLSSTTCASGFLQSVGVKGELGCPYRDEFSMQVFVELWSRDQFRMDAMIARVMPNSEGFFEIYGSGESWGTMTPYVRIRHNCCVYDCPISQELLLEVPQQYVSAGVYPLYWYEAGPIELANRNVGFNSVGGFGAGGRWQTRGGY